MGCGKSTVGALVAARRGAVFTDLDRLVEESAGSSVEEIFAVRGEAVFRELEKEMVAVALERGGVIALGGGTPMDDASWRALKARAVTVWLDAPLEQMAGRLGAGEGRPLAASGAPRELGRLYRQRRSRYADAHHRVEAGRPLEHVVEEVAWLWSE
ncbi:MAG: shikimate kinase [Candidatus Dormibacterales bacterium]